MKNEDVMPLQVPRSKENYIRTTKVYLDSEDKVEYTEGNTYRFKLATEIQDVIGCELSGYNLPIDAAPSFVSVTPGFNGTDKADFYLLDKSNSTKSYLDITFPERKLKKYDFSDSTRDYSNVLAGLLNEATALDPYFSAFDILWRVWIDYDNTVVIDLNYYILGDLEFGIEFSSGPNAEDGAYQAMGFEKLDYVGAANGTLQSPLPVKLDLFRYVDFTVQEFMELGLLDRVNISDRISDSYSNESNITRTRLLKDQPPRKLTHLTIFPALDGGRPIPSSVNFSLELVLFNLANEETIPSWVNQVFSI